MTMDNASYIKSLVQPVANKGVITRRVKSFDVDLLVRFGIAQNVEGNTNIPLEALGAPLRLATNKDGTVKFGASGKPSVKIAKEIVSFGTMIHQNIVLAIEADTARVASEKAELFNMVTESAVKAGEPLVKHDEEMLAKALAERAKAEAEAKAKAEAEAAAAAKLEEEKAAAVAEAEKATKSKKPAKEPVTVS